MRRRPLRGLPHRCRRCGGLQRSLGGGAMPRKPGQGVHGRRGPNYLQNTVRLARAHCRPPPESHARERPKEGPNPTTHTHTQTGRSKAGSMGDEGRAGQRVRGGGNTVTRERVGKSAHTEQPPQADTRGCSGRATGRSGHPTLHGAVHNVASCCRNTQSCEAQHTRTHTTARPAPGPRRRAGTFNKPPC